MRFAAAHLTILRAALLVPVCSAFNFSEWLHSEEGCYGQYAEDPYKIDWVHPSTFQVHVWFWLICFVCAACATLMTMVTLYGHFRSFINRGEQGHICRILLMVPIYAIDSFLSFRFYGFAKYLDVARECYEAFVIYSFVELLIMYAGGYEETKIITKSMPERRMVAPLCCFTIAPSRGLMRHVKRLTLQYVFLRPVLTVLTMILELTGKFCHGNFSPLHANLYIAITNFFSVTCAMYGLLTFYGILTAKNKMEHKAHKIDVERTGEAPDKNDHFQTEIDKKQLLWKFMSVKFVIFLSFWQGLVISLIIHLGFVHETVYWKEEDIGGGIQNFLICLEMLGASIWHAYVFSAEEYSVSGIRTNVFRSFLKAYNPKDIARELSQSFSPRPAKFVELSSGTEDQSPHYVRLSIPSPVPNSFFKKIKNAFSKQPHNTSDED